MSTPMENDIYDKIEWLTEQALDTLDKYGSFSAEYDAVLWLLGLALEKMYKLHLQFQVEKEWELEKKRRANLRYQKMYRMRKAS